MAGIPKTMQNWKDKTHSKQQGKTYPHTTDEKKNNHAGNYGRISGNPSALNNKQSILNAQASEEDIKYLKLLVNYGDEAAMEKLLELERTWRRAP
jgi:hypothetical protein